MSDRESANITKEKMTVLYVKPGEKPKHIEIENDLEALQRAVGGYIEAVYPYEDPVALIVNEEGKLSGLPLNRALRDEDTQLDALHKPVILADKQPGEEIELLRIEPPTRRTLTRAYQVAAYHHFENGFDDKLDYQTLEEAEAAAQGYVAGTMEEDGFA